MNILIADDHPLTLVGTKSFVESLGHKVCDICSNGITALNLIKTHRPDVAILDINMPGIDGIEVLEKVFVQKLRTKIVLLTMHKEITIFNKANQFGMHGYILKEQAQEELGPCLIELNNGNRYLKSSLLSDLILNEENENGSEFNKLTFSEKKIVELIAQQKTSKQIADLLFISEKTVEGHRRNIIHKLNLPQGNNVLLLWVLKHIPS